VARRIKKVKYPSDCKMQMTSMIDVVFLLLLFFMIVSEMVKMELEDITLPVAQKGVSEIRDPKGRLIINVTWDRYRHVSHIVIMKRVCDIQALATALRNAADAGKHSQEPGGPPTSEVLIKIRADADVPYEKVMVVMAQCAKAYIYKISFATKEPVGF